MSIAQNIKKTINYSRKNGYGEALCAAWERVTAKYYADYNYIPPSQETLAAQAADRSRSDIKFSILVPAFETQEVYLRALIDSCIAQSYANWELIIADGSATDVVERTVGGYDDGRIKYIRLGDNGGIADNTNRAIDHATGDYCGLLDHDDMLTADALYEMARVIRDRRPTLVYSDEDKCDSEGQRFYEPHFKQDFNLDLILTNNYICHFLVVDTETLRKLRIRKEYDGSQDFDLILRVVSGLLLKEREGQQADGGRMEDAILHVPKVLYHWRCHQNSTADNPQSKMYAYEAGKKALIDFTSRMGWKADVRHNKHLGFYRIVYRNDVLTHRPDLAAVGGYIVRHGKIASGIYRGQPIVYAGYMNRMDLYQNVTMLDIRNMALGKAFRELYERVTEHPYESTLAPSDYNRSGAPSGRELPQWIKELEKTAEGRKRLEKLSVQLSRQLLAAGGRLLLDPECIRKL
ncbi:MAG: glycosyltransferase [Roseburia sp.]|nr:glycosyltransferase [Roseburia sp.]